MIVSFIAAQTLVPVISVWLLKAEKFHYHHQEPHAHAGLALDGPEIDEIDRHRREDETHKEEDDYFQRLKRMLTSRLEKWMPKRKLIVLIYPAGSRRSRGMLLRINRQGPCCQKNK